MASRSANRLTSQVINRMNIVPDLRPDAGPSLLEHLRRLAVPALARMYRPAERLFAYRLKRTPAGHVLEGLSRRYTAITLIGLATEDNRAAAEALHGQSLDEVCAHLVRSVADAKDLGEVALTLWAARVLQHPAADEALRHLRARKPVEGPFTTVELSWCLAALAVDGSAVRDDGLAEALAGRILALYNPVSELFAHWPTDAQPSFLRAHVACFADLVYPVQALSHYYRLTRNPAALSAARQVADRMCALQGPDGQWWWHYDVRTGRVIEGYPVYAVHQHAMAPMALFAAQDAGAGDYTAGIANGLKWLVQAPEIRGSLIDDQAGIIWRKVARHERFKIVRTAQALASRLHPALRVPAVNWLARPGWIDFESRPYEMGWLLHAWPHCRPSTFCGATQSPKTTGAIRQ
jgi:hypothetical protein